MSKLVTAKRDTHDFGGRAGDITHSEPADREFTGLMREETGLMNRVASYNLAEGQLIEESPLRAVGRKREALVHNETMEIRPLTELSRNTSDKLIDADAIDSKSMTAFLTNTASIVDRSASVHLLECLNAVKRVRENKITVIISPGRSGTMSLFSLFHHLENFRPFHHIAFPISGQIINEFFYRGVVGEFASPRAWHTQGSLHYY